MPTYYYNDNGGSYRSRVSSSNLVFTLVFFKLNYIHIGTLHIIICVARYKLQWNTVSTRTRTHIYIYTYCTRQAISVVVLTPENNAFFLLSEAFAHNNKEEWLSDSDSQNTIICSTTSSSPGPSLASTSTGGGQKAGSSKAKQGSRSKDTPAGQKPAQVVARRNARERRRVQAVNWAFARLRKVVPLEENKWVQYHYITHILCI